MESERKNKYKVAVYTALATLAIVAVVALCTSCSNDDQKPVEKQPYHVTQIDSGWHYDNAFEECYKGVTYVVFPSGNASTMSVMFDRNSKVVPCEQ